MIEEKITRENDPILFYKLCEQYHIEYPSTVYSFERVEGWTPIYWKDVKPTSTRQEQ
jgi:hypothetical protein